MSLEEEVVVLRAEVTALREALAQAQARIAELERRKTPPPAFVRANTPTERPATPRRKRAPEHNAGRPREEPTQIVYHAAERCPDCGYRLRGQSVARTRQVIDLPEPAPVEVTEHRLLKRHCPACDRWWTPHVDFGSQVLGQGRLGVRLVSLIAYLRQRARLPVQIIQQVLATLHRLHLSVGAIVDLLHRLQRATQREQAALLEHGPAPSCIWTRRAGARTARTATSGA